MRAVVQRVSHACVSTVDGIVGEIDRGLLVLLGVASGDTESEAEWLADKIVSLRIFEGEGGKFDLGLDDVAGALLVVSQFTVYGETRKGRRPNFSAAAGPELAEALYEQAADRFKQLGQGESQQYTLQALSRVRLRQGRAIEAVSTMQGALDATPKPNWKNRLIKHILSLPSRLFKP